MSETLLTIEEAASRLKVSPEQVRRLCVSGKLPWVPVGTGEDRHCRRIRPDTLAAYMRNERHGEAKEEMENVKRTLAASASVEERW